MQTKNCFFGLFFNPSVFALKTQKKTKKNLKPAVTTVNQGSDFSPEGSGYRIKSGMTKKVKQFSAMVATGCACCLRMSLFGT